MIINWYSRPWKCVLIETLWNVNSIPATTNASPFRINRNIMECKWECFNLRFHLLDCINRNIMECKYTYSRLAQCEEPGY